MTHHSRLAFRPLGFVATVTLALGTAAAMPEQIALADSTLAPTAAVSNGKLVVHGTADADHISVGVAGAPAAVLVDLGTGAPPLSFDRTTVNAITVFLGGGNDTFSVSTQFSDLPLTVRGGPGADSISGSNGADQLFGGRGSDTIRGADGNDLVVGGRGDDNVNGERGTDTELLGSGSDTALWNPGDGNDIIDGGHGHDGLTFNGANVAESFVLSAVGSHALLTRDVAGIRMDMDSVEQLDLRTLAGVDTVHVGDLRGTDLALANIDLSAAGAPDPAADAVFVDGTARDDSVHIAAVGSTVAVTGLPAQTRISGTDTTDGLTVETGDGNDTVVASDAARALIALRVSLGAGQD